MTEHASRTRVRHVCNINDGLRLSAIKYLQIVFCEAKPLSVNLIFSVLYKYVTILFVCD